MKRVCLLTGASGRFGTAFIEQHAARYQIVALHHRRDIRFPTQDQRFVDPMSPSATVPGNDHPVHAMRVDLSRADEIDLVARELAHRYHSIDLVINAASSNVATPLLAQDSLAEAESVFAVNVLAPVRLAVALGHVSWRSDPEANASANRNIVNISSRAGEYMVEDLGLSLYAASKAALHHLTYHLASELWDLGIRVNALALAVPADLATIGAAVAATIDLDASSRTGEIIAIAGSAQQEASS